MEAPCSSVAKCFFMDYESLTGDAKIKKAEASCLGFFVSLLFSEVKRHPYFPSSVVNVSW